MNDEASTSQDAFSIRSASCYWIIFLDPDGTIVQTEALEALNNEHSIRAARRLMEDRALDL